MSGGEGIRGMRPTIDWEPSGEERESAEAAFAKVRADRDDPLPDLAGLEPDELYMLYLWVEELARRRGLVVI